MQIRFALMAVVMLAVFASGWSANSWRLGKQHAEYRETQQQALIKAQRARELMTAHHIAELAMLDERHIREMRDAQSEIDRLRDDVAAGRRRLSVAATCPDPTGVPTSPGAAGVDDGAGARLTGAAERDYWRLRERITAVTAQAEGLQDYVRRVCLHAPATD